MNPPGLGCVVFHRCGGLELTKRFGDGEWPSLQPGDWKVGSSPVYILFSSGAALESYIKVCQVEPKEGDVDGRFYTDAAGNNCWISLPFYGIVDPNDYLTILRTKIPEMVGDWATSESAAHREALRLVRAGMAPELLTLLQYDFGRFQKTGSAFLVGQNSLNVPLLPPDSLTLPGKSPLPRLITAQCDNVSSLFLAGLLSELFGYGNGALSKRLRSIQLMDIHIGYVALRVLVQGTVWILVDKERRHHQNAAQAISARRLPQDRSLEECLQGNMNSLVANFNTCHLGMSYGNILSGLPKEALEFYKDIDDEPVPLGDDGWKSTLFWLPALSDLLETHFEGRRVFGLY